MSVTAMVEFYLARSLAASGLSVGHGRSPRYGLSGPADGRAHCGPGWLIGSELLAQIGHKLGELIVGHAVLEGGHVAEIARYRRCNAVQNHLDQVVRHGAMQVAVQRQRRPAAEQRRTSDLMANRAGALIEPRAKCRC